MGYPPQGPWNQGGYPQQPQQPQQGGYPQPQQPFGQAPQQGYGPPAGQQPGAFMPQGQGGEYNFAELYGHADHTAGTLLEKGRYLGKPESVTYGRTRDGTKGAWTVVFRTVSGINKVQGAPGQGAKITVTISVSPTKQDGTENRGGLGIMFKQLHALGVPVGPPHDNGPAFWEQGLNEQMVAQHIMTLGRVVDLTVVQNEYPEGSGQFNNKVSRIDPVDQQPPQQAPAPQQPFSGPQQPPYGAAPPQQAPQPWQQPQPPQQGFPPQGGQANYQSGVPPYAQPAQPGQGGMQQFTPEGQGMQPGTVPEHTGQPPVPQPPWNNSAPGQPGPQQPGPQQGQAPPAPPWAQ
jgi:hypothetical protein